MAQPGTARKSRITTKARTRSRFEAEDLIKTAIIAAIPLSIWFIMWAWSTQ